MEQQTEDDQIKVRRLYSVRSILYDVGFNRPRAPNLSHPKLVFHPLWFASILDDPYLNSRSVLPRPKQHHVPS